MWNIRERIALLLSRRTGRARLRVPGTGVSPVFVASTPFEARKVIRLGDEEAPLRRFLGELRPGDLVYDVGSNIGLYAVPCALKLARLGPGPAGRSGRVVAFEPMPEWAARLRQNAAANRLGNLEVFEVALADQTRRMNFTIKSVAGSGMGSLVDGYTAERPGDPWKTIEVDVYRGDEFVAHKDLTAPNILKIDVEGAELDALRGLKSVLEDRRCRFALIEVHPQFGSDVEAVAAFLEASGFEVERGPSRRAEVHLFASRPS